MPNNPLKMDPTRTLTLRSQFVRDMGSRFNDLKKAVKAEVVVNDVFGLSVKPFAFNQEHQAYRFLSDSAKVAAFQEWLQGQIDAGILAVDVKGVEWTSQYIGRGYESGVSRAYAEAKKVGVSITAMAGVQARQQFLREVFATSISKNTLQSLFTRTFEELEGVTVAMSNQMSRTLTVGLARGDSAAAISRELTKNVDNMDRTRARVLARTEIIRSHAEAQLDSYEMLGIEEIGVYVEWSTAGDRRVCPKCSSLDGLVMTIKEARGLIPRHPNCRCSFFPAHPLQKSTSQKRTKRNIRAAITKSVKAEARKGSTTAQATARSTWIGARRPFKTKKIRKG